MPLTTLQQLDRAPNRYSGKKVRVRGRAIDVGEACLLIFPRRCAPSQAYLGWSVDPNSIMPEETSGYMIALRGQGGQPFECDERGCGALRLQHCYELIGTFKHTADPRLLNGLLTLKVEKHKEIPDRTEKLRLELGGMERQAHRRGRRRMTYNMTRSGVRGLLSHALPTALALSLLGCGAQDPKGSGSQEIYSGSPVDGSQVGVVYIEYKDGFGDVCSSGSGVMLTNTWLLSAAHVLDHQCPFPPVELKITMRGSLLNQTQTYQAGSFPFVFVHPKYVYAGPLKTAGINHGWDAALMNLSQPFTIGGSATGHVRRLTTKRVSDFILAGKKSVFGTSVTSPPTTWPPPPNAFGEPASADFTVVPFPGISLNPSKLAALTLNSAPTAHQLAVLRGGGLLPSANVADVIPVAGDSGGPMIDVTDPIFLHGDIIGLVESADPDASPSGVPRPEFAYFSAASGFRDYVRAVLAYNAPRVLLDMNGDGKQDSIGMSPSSTGSAVLDIQFGGGGSLSWDTTLPLPNGTLAGFFPGNFDGDGYDDLVGHIAGVPLYFRGGQVFNFANNLSSTWNLLTDPENLTNPVSYFTVGDFNFDGTSDLEVVRNDGASSRFLGESFGTKGLTSASHLAPRGFNFFGDSEESFAISAPGVISRLGLPIGLSPSEGVVYLRSNDGTTPYVDRISLGGLKTALSSGPGGELGDQFGAALVWGSFDGSALAHGLVVGAPGRSVGGATNAGIVAYLRHDTASPALVSATYFDASTFGAAPTTDAGFGSAMTVGDFNADTVDDLVVASDGGVHVLMGSSSSGLSASNAKLTLLPAHFNLSVATMQGGLAAADFNCDGFEDLAIGVSGAKVDLTERAGAVIINYGGPTGITLPVAGEVARWQRIDQSIPEIGASQLLSGQRFGFEMAAGNFNGDAFHGKPCVDLAISSEPSGSVLTLPGGPPPFPGKGAVDVVFGSPGGLTPTGSQRLQQGASVGGQAIHDSPEIDDRFGSALAVTAADADGFDDLVIGVNGEDEGRGVMHVLRGSPQGVTGVGQALWRQGQEKISSESPEVGEHFGGSVGGTSNGVVIVSAEDESFDGPTPADPDVSRAGWAAIVRLTDTSPVLQAEVVESTENSLTMFLTPPSPLREGARFGTGITAARPAFVPRAALPLRYGGKLVSGSARIGDLCQGDVTPPQIQAIAVTPNCLWPVNQKLVAYRLQNNLTVTVIDNCDVQPDVRITGVQVVDSGKSKKTPFFYGNMGFCLRSQRSGGSREYIVTLEARDDHGNVSTGNVTIQVPHSQGSGTSCPALDPKSFVKDGDPLCAF